MSSLLSQSIGLFIAVSAQFILRKNVNILSIQTNPQTKQITNWFKNSFDQEGPWVDMRRTVTN